MQKKIPTAFRLYQESLDQLDALVESPPAWLSSIMPGPIQDRTEVLERLIFLACKHHPFGMPADDQPPKSPAKKKAAGGRYKPKK